MYSPKGFSLVVVALSVCIYLCFSPFFYLEGGLGANVSPSKRRLMMMEEEGPLKIIFNGPARNWTDALPIGNGRLGAMVRGGVPSEVLNLNGMS